MGDPCAPGWSIGRRDVGLKEGLRGRKILFQSATFHPLAAKPEAGEGPEDRVRLEAYVGLPWLVGHKNIRLGQECFEDRALLRPVLIQD